MNCSRFVCIIGFFFLFFFLSSSFFLFFFFSWGGGGGDIDFIDSTDDKFITFLLENDFFFLFNGI